MSAYSILRDAIQKKQNVAATYKDHYREMSPHTLGAKKGRQKALLYQFGGSSSSGLGPAGSTENWRCVFVDELQNVKVIGGEWHSAPNHSRPQTCVDEIDVEVTF